MNRDVGGVWTIGHHTGWSWRFICILGRSISESIWKLKPWIGEKDNQYDEEKTNCNALILWILVCTGGGQFGWHRSRVETSAVRCTSLHHLQYWNGRFQHIYNVEEGACFPGRHDHPRRVLALGLRQRTSCSRTRQPPYQRSRLLLFKSWEHVLDYTREWLPLRPCPEKSLITVR